MTRSPAETALERCLDEDEWPTVARFRAWTPMCEFSVEFGAQGVDPPAWNVADSPPIMPDSLDHWPVRDDGRNRVLLESQAQTGDEALDELVEIAEAFGASDITLQKTFAGAEHPLKDLRDLASHHVIEPAKSIIGVSER